MSNLKNKKNKSYKRYRADINNINLREEYKQLQKEFDALNSFLYKTYIIVTENSIKENSKVFWHFINSKRKSNGLPTYMYYLDHGSTNTNEICNLFAKYFMSVYTESSSSVPDFSHLNPIFNISEVIITVNDIENSLLNIKNKTSLDCDGICNDFLKQCSKYVCPALLIIFEKSLSVGVFLDHWKVSQVVPIFKSGSKQDITNYRPISKIPCIPKLFEQIVSSKLSMTINKSLSENQHGFRAGRSTATNLVLFCNYIFKNFNNRQQTDVIFTDFAKAFDKVDHGTLVCKLNFLGFTSNILSWLSSYLSNRYQYVLINSISSDKFSVTSGVPQGSHLGPLLFLLFINDLPDAIINSESLLFADDLKIFRTISNLDDCMLLQMDLNNVANWCEANNLLLNIKKCHSFSFFRSLTCIDFKYNINETELTRLQIVKDLGIILDSKLSFDEHLDYVISKSLSMLGFLKRNTSDFTNIDSLLCLYTSLVRPHLEYCSIVWNPIHNCKIVRLEKVQKNFTRYAYFKLGWNMDRPCYSVRCALFGLSSLDCRRKMFSIIFVRDIVKSNIQCPALLQKLSFYSPIRPLRENFYFVLHFYRSQYCDNETIQHCCKITNTVINKIDIFNDCSRNIFKTNLVLILNQK